MEVLDPPSQRQDGAAAARPALLAGVLEACRLLLAVPAGATDLPRQWAPALQALGRAGGHGRVQVLQIEAAPGAPDDDGSVLERAAARVFAHWPTEAADDERFGARCMPLAEMPALWARLLADQPATPGHGAPAGLLALPLRVAGRCWGALVVSGGGGGDERLPALSTAAAALAATLRPPPADAHLSAALLDAARELLAVDDLEAGLPRWLGTLAQAADADAALLVTRGDDGRARPRASWRRDGADAGGSPLADDAAWLPGLRAGEPVWVPPEALRDALARAHGLPHGGRSRLLLPLQPLPQPLPADDPPAGWVAIDWERPRDRPAELPALLLRATAGLAAALQRHDAAQARRGEHDARVARERRRADAAALGAQRLAIVAAAAEELLAAVDLDAGLAAVLQRVGPPTAAARLRLLRLHPAADDATRHGWLELKQCWTAADAVGPPAPPRVELRRDDATAAALLERLRCDPLAPAPTGALLGPAAAGTPSLAFALQSDAELRGLLVVDPLPAADGADVAGLHALQMVASTIAQALRRCSLEQCTLAAEQARADDSARLATLLGHVVSSSRLLIDADPADFEPALLRWLGAFGAAIGAQRATFYDSVQTAAGPRVVRALGEWVRPGLPAGQPVSFAEPLPMDPCDADDVLAAMQVGDVMLVHSDQTQPPLRECLLELGCATLVVVPIFFDGVVWGHLSFDHAQHREPTAGERAVLQTAADTLATVLKRNEAARALLGEREARLATERQRVTELALANEALRVSLDALAEAGSEDAFLHRALLELARQSGALVAYLFRSSSDTGLLRLVGSVRDGRFSAEGEAGDPPQFRRGFAPRPAMQQQLVQRGRMLWRRLDEQTPESEYTPQTLAWHRREGHAANAVHAMAVGARLVGMVGLVFDHDRPLGEPQLELLHALCQPLALALELARLARQAQRSAEQAAVLDERNRLAREIHDGIAQSFLAIQMQLGTLSQPVAAPVAHAQALARHGLTEARRAVAALRPHALLNRDLPSAVERLLSALTAGSTVVPLVERPASWQRLPVEVEDHLYRIVQEAANNALRHAQAQTLRVELSQATGELTVLVADDGIGFDRAAAAAQAGFGLEGIRQRARLIGARVQWLSQPGSGTQVLVSLPTPPAGAATATATTTTAAPAPGRDTEHAR